MRAQAALVVPDQFLGREPSCTLNIAAFNLPNINGRGSNCFQRRAGYRPVKCDIHPVRVSITTSLTAAP